ncbi:MAG: PAS domain-containing protein, partial [Dehalococcoidia bacterium]|nr:PAS domain-containing protein [Dehalococcoidia bacterium]
MPDHQTSPGNLLQALLAAIPSPIAAWALDGRLLGCSGAFLALLGRSEEEVAAIGRVSLLEESDREAAR